MSRKRPRFRLIKWKQFRIGKCTITINKLKRIKRRKPKDYAEWFFKKYPHCK